MSLIQDELIVLDETADPAASNPVVLQPSKNLIGQAGKAFQEELQAAIAQAGAVIVDLLWVREIEPTLMSVLAAGMQQAHRLGKSLSLLSLNAKMRSQIEAIWQQEHQTQILSQAELFLPEFERFLEQNREQ